MRVGLILPGSVDTPLPSTRVALLNISPHLLAAGIETIVLHQSPIAIQKPTLDLDADAIVAAGIQVVIFQKVHGPSTQALASKLARCGVRTVFMVCDHVDVDMATACSATVCATEYLASLYPKSLTAKLHVVHDGIERPEVEKTEWRVDRGSSRRPLRAILVTSFRLNHLPLLRSPPPWLRVDIVGRYPRDRDWIGRAREHWRSWHESQSTRREQLRLALHPRIRLHAWTFETVYQLLPQADIGIIPVERDVPIGDGSPPPDWSVKSENRLTLKMAVGLPVIATPIPSYKPVVRHGENAFLAETEDDWFRVLQDLRSPELRSKVGLAARQSVISKFSLERQAERLITVLRALVAQHRP